MSKFVNEIINDLKSNPTMWKDYCGCGCIKNNIRIDGYGNTRALSTTSVYINNKRMPTTYVDNWKLEVAINNWYRTISLQILL